MVARDTPSRAPRLNASRLLNGVWRRWASAVGRAAGATRRAATGVAGRERPFATLASALGDPRAFASRATRRQAVTVAIVGASAFALGAVGRIAILAALDEPLGPAATAIAASACWTAGRWAVFAVLTSVGTRVPGDRVLAAWAVGLMPYAAAVWWPLAIPAFAASIVLTHRSLEGATGDRHRADLLCALAYGAEAVGALTNWVVANGLLIALVGP